MDQLSCDLFAYSTIFGDEQFSIKTILNGDKSLLMFEEKGVGTKIIILILKIIIDSNYFSNKNI